MPSSTSSFSKPTPAAAGAADTEPAAPTETATFQTAAAVSATDRLQGEGLLPLALRQLMQTSVIAVGNPLTRRFNGFASDFDILVRSPVSLYTVVFVLRSHQGIYACSRGTNVHQLIS